MKANSLKLDGRFKKQIKGRVNAHVFDVGILKNAPHKSPRSSKAGLKNFAGGLARKLGRKSNGVTLEDVSEDLRKRLKFNFYTRPFKMKTNKEIIRFTNAFIKTISRPNGTLKEKKRLENLLQAIVRNPILRGDYGSNSKVTSAIKGFNRLMIDTGQLFKGITARVGKR